MKIPYTNTKNTKKKLPHHYKFRIPEGEPIGSPAVARQSLAPLRSAAFSVQPAVASLRFLGLGRKPSVCLAEIAGCTVDPPPLRPLGTQEKKRNGEYKKNRHAGFKTHERPKP